MFRILAVSSAALIACLVLVSPVSSATGPAPVGGDPIQGDAVFRGAELGSKPWESYRGHAGIGAPMSVRAMQITGRDEDVPTGELVTTDLEVWSSVSTYRGAWHMGQSVETGKAIAASLKAQRYTVLALTEGYKSPSVSFRCDGLLEWAYENSEIDIVQDDEWSNLDPWTQIHAMTPR
jgi:hypothetical protein